MTFLNKLKNLTLKQKMLSGLIAGITAVFIGVGTTSETETKQDDNSTIYGQCTQDDISKCSSKTQDGNYTSYKEETTNVEKIAIVMQRIKERVGANPDCKSMDFDGYQYLLCTYKINNWRHKPLFILKGNGIMAWNGSAKALADGKIIRYMPLRDAPHNISLILDKFKSQT